MSIPNLDNEILDLELMLPIMDKTCGGGGGGKRRCILLVGIM